MTSRKSANRIELRHTLMTGQTLQNIGRSILLPCHIGHFADDILSLSEVRELSSPVFQKPPRNDDNESVNVTQSLKLSSALRNRRKRRDSASDSHTECGSSDKEDSDEDTVSKLKSGTNCRRKVHSLTGGG